MEIKEILENLGFGPITETPDYYRCRPIYRDSDNDTVLSINKKTGFWKDFKLGQSGSIGQLVKIVLKLDSIIDAYQLLEKDFEFAPKSVISVPKIKIPKKFSEDFAQGLVKNYDYWNNRGISNETLDQFEGGIHTKTNRYYFIIRGENKNIIGLAGRTLGNNKIKWLLRGNKKSWFFPLQNRTEIEQKREVILLESVGDLLSLNTCGIKTGLVCFGVELSNEMITNLIKINPKKIFISFNNDNTSTGAGNLGSEKVRNRLLRYFDNRQIKIALPPTKDINDLLLVHGKDKVLSWYQSI